MLNLQVTGSFVNTNSAASIFDKLKNATAQRLSNGNIIVATQDGSISVELVLDDPKKFRVDLHCSTREMFELATMMWWFATEEIRKK